MVTNHTGSTTARLRHGDPDYIDAYMFLVEEAELLDDGDLTTWFTLMSPELTYTMPVRVSRARNNPDPGPAGAYLVDEDYRSFALRVKRLTETETVWSENPPSHYRRFISNVRVLRGDNGELHVRSYELVMRSRKDRDTFDFIPAERRDVLVRTDSGALQLRTRQITIAQSRLSVRNLPLPL